MFAIEVIAYGLIAGLGHIAVIAALYGNPWVARIHRRQAVTEISTQAPPARPRKLSVHMLGTQLEVYAMTMGYGWLHPLLRPGGLLGATLLAALFGVLRVLAPVWSLWLQGRHSRGYLAVEVITGMLGSFVVVMVLAVLW